MKKFKKILLICLTLLIGSIATLWAFAKIYTYYNPPVAADGRLVAQEFLKSKKQNGSLVLETKKTADIKKVCSSKTSNFFFLEGLVKGIETYPPKGADCFNKPESCFDGKVTEIASLETKETQKTVFIYIEPQAIEEYRKHEPYFETGKEYSLCGEKTEYFDFIAPEAQNKMEKYKIDLELNILK